MKEEIKTSNSQIILTIRWIASITIAVIVLFFVGRTFSKAFYTRHIVIEVTDKAVKNNKYMVYGKTVDLEHLAKSYEITDSALAGRYDSSDMYGEIEIGKTYEFIVGGNRVSFMSWYPDIYSAVEVKVLQNSDSKDSNVETESEDFVSE